VNALVRVSAHLASIEEAKGAPRLEPLFEQVARESFAQGNPGRLVEPCLRHV